MEQEIKSPMDAKEATEVLEQVKIMLRVYATMFQDILHLITVSAEMGLDSVDSKLLIQIMERHNNLIRKL